jgi:hypothetical protein
MKAEEEEESSHTVAARRIKQRIKDAVLSS